MDSLPAIALRRRVGRQHDAPCHFLDRPPRAGPRSICPASARSRSREKKAAAFCRRSRCSRRATYLVPHVGSEPYFRKPPLVNWLVAASFKLTGQRNEWTARLPSALCVLAVALAFLTVARASLGANGSLIAALIWMVNFGMIEKGRLIEIEALYVSLLGLAMICWLSWWEQRRSPWLTWIVPSDFPRAWCARERAGAFAFLLCRRRRRSPPRR